MAGTPTAERPPQGLNAHWLGVWRHALKTLKAQGTWTWEQAPLLTEYVYALREAEDARAEAQTNPYRETDQGLLHPHPGFSISDRAVKRANTLAKTLRLTHEEQEKLRKTRAGKDESLRKDKTPEEIAAEEFDALDEEADELAARRRAKA